MFVVATLISCDKKSEATQPEALVYPETRKADHVDTYFGTDIQDPYRWLEEIGRASCRERV